MKLWFKQTVGRIGKDIWSYRAVGAGLVLYYIIMKLLFSAFCPSVILTGFPCPGCGLTRAALFAVTGQFERAWNMNPLIYGWILFAGYAGVQRYFLDKKVNGWKVILTILAAAMIGVYIYRMYRYFPNRPPMSFTRGSLFEKALPGYGRIIREFIYK